MKMRACPVCNGTKQTVIQNIKMNVPEDYHLPAQYDVVACADCGMVYADTAASMEDYDWYYTHCNFYGDDSKDDNTERYDWMEELLEKYLTKNSVMLELGAGNGRYSIALKRNGYARITATDPSGESVERLQNAGVNAYVTNIYSEAAPEEQGKYDAVFLFEVAEHLLLPQKGIANVASLLRMGGYFMLSVPDYSLIAEDTCNIPNYFNLEHINYFSEDSLDTLMAQYQLKRVDQKRLGGDLILVYKKTTEEITVKKDEKTEAAVRQYLNRQQERQAQIEAKVGQLQKQEKELFIWGTGSYVMSLLATTALDDCKILGFVDNNRIKQGREMYGRLIYAPEYLLDKHGTVVICSMLYSAQIKKQLEDMHTKNEIVIL